MTLKSLIESTLDTPRQSLRIIMRDTRDETPQGVLEIFPDRIKPKNGKSLYDAIMTMIADFHQFNPHNTRGAFHQYKGENWLNFSDHPDAHVDIGAVFYHTGNATDGLFVETDEETIHFPGESFPRIGFSAGTTYAQRQAQTKTDIYSEIAKKSFDSTNEFECIRSLALGAISAFIGTPYAERYTSGTTPHPGKIVGAVAARANRVLINKHSGKIALAKGLEAGESLVSDLETIWALRPDSGYNPKNWVSTPLLNALFKQAEPSLFASGQAMVEAARTYKLIGNKAVYAEGNSAHDAIMAYQGQSEVDKALFNFCSPELLKPRAASAAQKAQDI